MKIFNWMCRRFNDDKDKSIDNVKQNDNENENYKQSLMNDEFDDDQWMRGGLLTIGTFGMDPHHKNYLINQPNDEYYCPNYYNMVEKYDQVKKEEEIMNDDQIPKSYIINAAADDDEYVTHDFCDDQSEALIKIKKMDGVDQLSDHEIMVEKKERITLADLFKADSPEMEEKPQHKLIKKKATTTPPGKLPDLKLLKKKQMSPTSIKQISQPVQKLLKRMLKRKIHPELEGKTKSCADGGGVPSTKRELGAHDSMSLLQTPHGINSVVTA